MYADESGLLVFGVSLTSASLSKNEFFDRLQFPECIPAFREFINVPIQGGGLPAYIDKKYKMRYNRYVSILLYLYGFPYETARF